MFNSIEYQKEYQKEYKKNTRRYSVILTKNIDIENKAIEYLEKIKKKGDYIKNLILNDVEKNGGVK